MHAVYKYLKNTLTFISSSSTFSLLLAGQDKYPIISLITYHHHYYHSTLFEIVGDFFARHEKRSLTINTVHFSKQKMSANCSPSNTNASLGNYLSTGLIFLRLFLLVLRVGLDVEDICFKLGYIY